MLPERDALSFSTDGDARGLGNEGGGVGDAGADGCGGGGTSEVLAKERHGDDSQSSGSAGGQQERVKESARKKEIPLLLCLSVVGCDPRSLSTWL